MAEQVTKKEWTEPELLVLVRSRRGEAVLGYGWREGVGGPSFGYRDCDVREAPECFPIVNDPS